MKIIQHILKVTAIGSLLLLGGSISAQQMSLFNNNIVNPYSINPARAGLTDNQMFFQHRQELVGIDGAPELSLLTAEFRLAKSKSAIGFQFSHEQANVIKNTAAFVTYASHFKLNDTQNLSFGLSLGVRQNGIAFDRVNVLDQGDEILFDYNQSSTNFDGNFGINYQLKKLEVQLSAHQLFGKKATYFNTFEQKELNYQFLSHIVGSIGYQFFENEKIKVKPIIQIRGVQGLPFLPEAILRFDYNDIVWLAGHYRMGATWAATAGVNISERFTVGYSAEFSTNKIAKYNGGTHEIIFGIKLKAPSKSSINPKLLKDMEKRNRSYEERLEYMNQENNDLEKELEKQRKRIEEIENSSNKLDYNEIKRLINEANNKEKETIQATKKEEMKKIIQIKAKSIQFESGNNHLKPSSYPSLNEIVKVLKENPNTKVKISGHTDNLGTGITNKNLAQARADVVKDFFVKEGVDIQRINAVGYGDENPTSSNQNSAGRALNRRVEIELEF